MQDDIQEVLLDEEAILGRVRELAEEISEDYAGCDPVLVCILKGAAVFLADLVRRITIPVTLDFMATSVMDGGREHGRCPHPQRPR